MLRKASDTPIKRHIKIKGAANPHDQRWYGYFDLRRSKKV